MRSSFSPSLQTKYHALQRRYRLLAQTNHSFAQAHQELLHINAQFEALATTDALTGILNHRATNTAIETEQTRSFRYQHVFALLFFDLDHFKAINDGYGHAAGDAVLKDLVAIAQCTLRTCDVIGRWGGEEFLAILPETNEEGAQMAAERLRAEVASYTFTVGGGLHLTCSIGIATFPADAHDRGSLIAAADQAMYAAKKLGRNQVRCFSDPMITALDATADGVQSRDEMTLWGTVEALATMAGARDPSNQQHAERVGNLCLQLAMAYGMQPGEAQMVEIAGRLHDIGKIAIAEAILRKTAPLSAHEWQSLQQHPLRGAEIVSHIPMLRGIGPMIAAHHERWDGSGYPKAMTGEDIPLGARMIAVAEAFDVITTQAPIRSMDAALTELHRCAGTQFDPQIVHLLACSLADAPR